jgi:hypothetical protein
MTPTLVARPRREVGAEQARVYAPMGDSKAATTIKIGEGMETRRGEDTVILLFFLPYHRRLQSNSCPLLL